VHFLYYKTVHLLYCHFSVPILQNGPVTLLSLCNSNTTKRSSYCIVTVHFLYYKTVPLLCCHSAVPILQNGPVTVLSQCSSYTTKRYRCFIVTMQFLYHKTVHLLYCHSTVPIPQNGPVTVLSQCCSYTTKRSSYCIVTVQFLYRCSKNFPSLSNAWATWYIFSALLQQVSGIPNFYLRETRLVLWQYQDLTSSTQLFFIFFILFVRCSVYDGEDMFAEFLVAKPERKRPLGRPRHGCKRILRCTFRKAVVRTGSSWLTI